MTSSEVRLVDNVPFKFYYSIDEANEAGQLGKKFCLGEMPINCHITYGDEMYKIIRFRNKTNTMECYNSSNDIVELDATKNARYWGHGTGVDIDDTKWEAFEDFQRSILDETISAWQDHFKGDVQDALSTWATNERLVEIWNKYLSFYMVGGVSEMHAFKIWHNMILTVQSYILASQEGCQDSNADDIANRLVSLKFQKAPLEGGGEVGWDL